MGLYSNTLSKIHQNYQSVTIKKENTMQNDSIIQENLAAGLEAQKNDVITKKISFKKETLRNLVTIASREHFESKLKQDELLSLTLDEIINSYYKQYWDKNKPLV